MFFAGNLRFLRKANNYTQNYIAEKLGYKSFTTVQKWETGEATPRYQKLVELAELFGVDVNTFTSTDMTSDSFIASHADSSISVPVYETIPAGHSDDAAEDIQGYVDIPSNYLRGKSYFALKIRGESMNPDYKDGDIVVFEKANDCNSVEDCAVRLNGGEVIFRRIRKSKDCIILQPLNPLYEPMQISTGDIISDDSYPSAIEILGIAREIRRSV
ncbi:MAG: helix-turn-helix domain-containing protein [Mogibacterium sp.]|nr:helix-turn-helix domain-containing protein [Mogibacterium sp.]